MNRVEEKEMESFIRIARARIGNIYRFPPQQRAVVARMYREWRRRKDSLIK